MEEKRSHPRMRSLKAARIVLPGGYSTFDCTIRNVSSLGAKIVLESTVGIPDGFGLKFEDGSVQNCTVKWRTQKELGVSFAKPD